MKRMIFAVCLLALGAMAMAETVWVQDGSGFTGTYRDIQMLTDSTGWVVGDNGVVAKREGKLHPQSTETVWISQTNVMPGGTQYGYDFKGVCFADANNGWIVGYSNGGPKKYMGVIVRTTDGGDTWLPPVFSNRILGLQGTSDSLTPFLKVKMTLYSGQYRGYITCGNGYILKWRPDPNNDWSPMRPPAPNNDPFSVWYKDLWMNANDPDQVWAIGDNSGIFAGTQNGGLSWEFEYPSQFSQTYNWPANTNTPLGTRLANLSLYGGGYNDMYYGLSYGTVSRYSAGWSSLLNIGNDNWIYDLDSGPGGLMFTCGNNSIWRIEAGTPYNEYSRPVSYSPLTFNAMDFTPSKNHGYAAGYVHLSHRYEPAGITGFTVTRIGNYLTAQWQSTTENNLRKWQICYHGIYAQDGGMNTTDSLLPLGGVNTFFS